MQCMRRPAIDPVTRVTIAVPACLGLGVYGESTRIARFSQVSRLFVSTRLWQWLALYTLAVCDPWSAQASRKEVARSSLLLRREGPCALAAISPILKPLGLPCSAMGSMAQRLATDARALPKAALSGTPIVLLLWDESCTLGQPLLLTGEPRSLAMLKIELGDHREAEPWKNQWEAFADAGLIAPPPVVAAQGAGWVKGWALRGLRPPPDVFQLLRPLAIWGERFSRQALAAIAWAYERGGLASGRSEAGSTKRMASYEAAEATADEQISRSEHGCSLGAE